MIYKLNFKLSETRKASALIGMLEQLESGPFVSDLKYGRAGNILTAEFELSNEFAESLLMINDLTLLSETPPTVNPLPEKEAKVDVDGDEVFEGVSVTTFNADEFEGILTGRAFQNECRSKYNKSNYLKLGPVRYTVPNWVISDDQERDLAYTTEFFRTKRGGGVSLLKYKYDKGLHYSKNINADVCNFLHAIFVVLSVLTLKREWYDDDDIIDIDRLGDLNLYSRHSITGILLEEFEDSFEEDIDGYNTKTRDGNSARTHFSFKSKGCGGTVYNIRILYNDSLAFNGVDDARCYVVELTISNTGSLYPPIYFPHYLFEPMAFASINPTI